MTAFPADFVSDEVEEQSAWHDGISAVLLGLSVLIWTCFWGAVWLSSLLYVALHHGDEHPSPHRPRFPKWRRPRE